MLKRKRAVNVVNVPGPAPVRVLGASGRPVVAKRNALLAVLMWLIVVTVVPRKGSVRIPVLGRPGESVKARAYVGRPMLMYSLAEIVAPKPGFARRFVSGAILVLAPVKGFVSLGIPAASRVAIVGPSQCNAAMSAGGNRLAPAQVRESASPMHRMSGRVGTVACKGVRAIVCAVGAIGENVLGRECVLLKPQTAQAVAIVGLRLGTVPLSVYGVHMVPA